MDLFTIFTIVGHCVTFEMRVSTEKYMSAGTVEFDEVTEDKLVGRVFRELGRGQPGLIRLVDFSDADEPDLLPSSQSTPEYTHKEPSKPKVLWDRGVEPGTVTRMSHKKDRRKSDEAAPEDVPMEQGKDVSTEGTVESGESNGAKEDITEYCFERRDLLHPRDVIGASDLVEFCLAKDKRSGLTRATRIARPMDSGEVVSIHGNHGYMRVASGRYKGKEITFHAAEAPRGVTLSYGDLCKFGISSNPRNDELSAVRITRTQEGTPLKDIVFTHKEWDGKVPEKKEFVRIPKGPDGTKGFGAGRGKVIDPPAEPAVPGLPPSQDPAAAEQ